ncbi:hypothetical protein HDV03_004705 [Kappamyces sp. JEL0829]|nr:hypothetical protein HDV03_004705 [Kappamyces sp. JEL0829]
MLAGSRQYFQGQSLESSIAVPMQSLRLGSPSSPRSPAGEQGAAIVSAYNSSPDFSPASSGSFGQSYMILDRNAREVRPDNEEEDPFNKFWEAVEGLVHKISGPVAFTTAPLGKSEERLMEAAAAQQTADLNLGATSFLNSYLVIKPGDELVESRYPVAKESRHARTLEECEAENAQLKRTVELQAKRIAELERAQQENNMLRSSIIQFRQDLQKQRAINPQLYASIPPGSSGNTVSYPRGPSRAKLSMSMNQPVPRPPLPQAASQDSPSNKMLLDKVHHLENELAKAQEQIQTQQRKWDKLKETVKKKKESKVAGISGSASEISIVTDNATPEPFAQPGQGKSAVPPMMRSPSGSSMYFSMGQSRFGN